MRDDINFSGAMMRWHNLWKVLITFFLAISSMNFSQAQIGVAKTIPLPGVRSAGSANRIIVTYELRIQNTGADPVHQIQIEEDLSGQLGAPFMGLVGTPQIITQPPSTTFKINPSYDGDVFTDLLVVEANPDADTLRENELLHLSLEVEINLGTLADGQVLYNQSVVNYRRVNSLLFEQVDSDSGTDPESTNPNDPLILSIGGDPSGSADPTPLPYCASCELECMPTINSSFDVNCQKDVRLIYQDIVTGRDSSICALLGFYTFDVTDQFGASKGPILTPTYFQDPSCFTVMIRSICRPGKVCMSMLCLKQNDKPFIAGSDTTVYCYDSLVTDPTLSASRLARISCQGDMQAEFVGDWVEVRDCDLGVEDTAKIIYRQYAATSKSGIRSVGNDTIYVLRLPPITEENLYCAEKDTIYCHEENEDFGPFIVVPPIEPGGDCDTVYLVNSDLSARDINPKCGFSVKVDAQPFGGTGCNRLAQVEVQIFQDCFGAARVLPAECAIPPSDAVISGGGDQPIYATCSFWLIELDTTGPEIECDLSGFRNLDTIGGIPTGEVDAGFDCVSSNMILPPASVIDDCNDLLQVKAMVDTFGAFPYEYDPISGQYVNNLHIPLPMRDEPYLVIFEALDVCLNLTRDTCAVIVKDRTVPTVVTEPCAIANLNASLDEVGVDQVDLETYDNCELSLLLVRRSDWLADWTDFCDSIRDEVDLGDDTIWCHKIFDPTLAVSELEIFYAGQLDYLDNSTLPGADLVAAAWRYDLCRYATVDCRGAMSLEEFNAAFATEYSLENIDEMAAIGGGWGLALPISCADACDTVDVELLAVDGWYNWSTGWGKVKVDDKSEPTVAQALTDYLEVSCRTYNLDTIYTLDTAQVPLSDIVEAAKAGNQEALAALDDAFGTYVKGWPTPSGRYIDGQGAFIPEKKTFVDRGLCRFMEAMISRRYYDPDAMMMMTENVTVDQYYVKDTTLMFDQGILEVACESMRCVQSVAFEPDDCGLGTIIRTFDIWKDCGGDASSTLTLTQEIKLINTCDLKKEQFKIPQDTIVYGCFPTASVGNLDHINGDVDPDLTGRPIYLFEDSCRNIGVARVDQSTTVSGPEDCFLIMRTWYFADWCVSEEVEDWWKDESIVTDSCVQLIALRDSMRPQCEIIMADTIVLDPCGQVINPVVQFEDDCSLYEFHYAFDTIGGSLNEDADSPRNMSGRYDTVTLSFDNHTNGRYALQIITFDHCGNESVCYDTVVIECDPLALAASAMDMPDHAGVVPHKMNGDEKEGHLRIAPMDDQVMNLLDPETHHLYQNRPNPFSDRSAIGFYIPEDTEVELSIFDVQGRLLKTYAGRYGRGHHDIQIDRSSINATGLLYYRLQTPRFTATRRMIITP